jgi:enoyl-CoA hydratase/carnithine racemase
METTSKVNMSDFQMVLTKHSPAFWRISFDNPPINLWTLATIQGINKVLDEMETDENAKVLVFDSNNEDFFTAHLDIFNAQLVKETKGPSGFNAWTDLTLRIYKS